MEIGKKLFVDVRTYGRTDGRTDGRTHLSSNLLGHRQGDDLKIEDTCNLSMYSVIADF